MSEKGNGDVFKNSSSGLYIKGGVSVAALDVESPIGCFLCKLLTSSLVTENPSQQ